MSEVLLGVVLPVLPAAAFPVPVFPVEELDGVAVVPLWLLLASLVVLAPVEPTELPLVLCEPVVLLGAEFWSVVDEGDADVDGEVELTPFDVPWFAVPVWLFVLFVVF